MMILEDGPLKTRRKANGIEEVGENYGNVGNCCNVGSSINLGRNNAAGGLLLYIGSVTMSQKRIRIQKKKGSRREETPAGVKIPNKVKQETKKKIADAKECAKKIDDLAKEELEFEKKMRELLLEIDEAMKQRKPAEWHLKYIPIARDCVGNPFDLRRWR